MNIGVPRGSILGPTFFKMFINDVFDCIPNDNCSIIAYADDVTCIFRSVSADSVARLAFESLEVLTGWFRENK